MATVNIHEAKTHLSRLLERVQQGESIVIAKAGVPVAQLTPIPRVDIVFGSLVGQLDIDFAAFDAADAEVAALWHLDDYATDGGTQPGPR